MASAVSRDFGLTPELLSFLRAQEGLVLHPYKDQVGLPTIGYGHRIPTMEHATLTPQEAEDLLRTDVRAKRDAVLALSPALARATSRRLAAVLDFVFNCGEGAYARSQMRRFIDREQWIQAGDQALLWDHAGGRKLPELTKRCQTRRTWLIEG